MEGKQRKRKGAKTIADELFQIKNSSANDTFHRKLGEYVRIVSELDYGSELAINKMDDLDYDEFRSVMTHMAKEYGVSYLEDWCDIKQPGDLYRIHEEGQIHFYQETRCFFMALHRRDHGEARKAYARAQGIQTPSSALGRKEEHMLRIYGFIKEELFGPRSIKRLTHKNKMNKFDDLDSMMLLQEKEKLQAELNRVCDGLEMNGQDTEKTFMKEELLEKLLGVCSALLKRAIPEDLRKRLSEDRINYRKSLEELKAKAYHSHSDPEILRLRLNLLEGTTEERFIEEDPTQEKANRIYGRCQKKFDLRAAKLLDDIIEETIKDVSAELEKEERERNADSFIR